MPTWFRWLAFLPAALLVQVFLTLLSIPILDSGADVVAAAPLVQFLTIAIAAVVSGYVAPRAKGLVAFVTGLVLLVAPTISYFEPDRRTGKELPGVWAVLFAGILGAVAAGSAWLLAARRAKRA